MIRNKLHIDGIYFDGDLFVTKPYAKGKEQFVNLWNDYYEAPIKNVRWTIPLDTIGIVLSVSKVPFMYKVLLNGHIGNIHQNNMKLIGKQRGNI